MMLVCTGFKQKLELKHIKHEPRLCSYLERPVSLGVSILVEKESSIPPLNTMFYHRYLKDKERVNQPHLRLASRATSIGCCGDNLNAYFAHTALTLASR